VGQFGIQAPARAVQLHVRLLRGLATDADTVLAAGEASRSENEETVLRIQRTTVRDGLTELGDTPDP
jgi:hypothetical protein